MSQEEDSSSTIRDPALPGDWDGLVVLHAANPWDGVKLADQHMAEALSRLVPVLYVDPPMSVLTPLRRPERRASLHEPRLRLLAPSLARLTPVVLPGPGRPGMARLTTMLLRRAMRRATKALGGKVRAVVSVSSTMRTLGACAEPCSIYWAQDDFVAGAGLFGQSAKRIRQGEAQLAAAADLIVASSPVVADAWRARGRAPVLIPFGCDARRFACTDRAEMPDDLAATDLTGPVAGFVGHLGSRIDLDVLEAVAATGCSLLLVGPRHPRFELERMGRLLARPNVRWVGPKPFDQLPSYLRLIDVGLVPYTASRFNQGSFPLKTLEYLAAGRGVVATDLPAVRWLDTDLIQIADCPASYARAVTRALAQPRTADVTERRRAFAAEHSWPRRAEALATILGARPEDGAAGTRTGGADPPDGTPPRIVAPDPENPQGRGALHRGRRPGGSSGKQPARSPRTPGAFAAAVRAMGGRG